MTPTDFPETNKTFHHPEDLDDSQVQSIRAFVGNTYGGSMDGAPVVVTAWQPSPHEIDRIVAGAPVFLVCVGGLPPHYLATSFEDAIAIK